MRSIRWQKQEGEEEEKPKVEKAGVGGSAAGRV